ncbi:hypothetical protein [Bradyrhizobium sp. CCBAU 51753]|uniref:hypothetical protein n=1 Tax=Bradyrhizobium sp. CCBAU 51753 TaxID=1325100 RepID=UPI001889DAD5|nr:hypothetical protein [Bradyrhizobium sp. CCBAU 51753]QOZ25332.1 hypothetical protein XH93_18325 [Bradyrhizobium sp. CCBAU 51753]
MINQSDRLKERHRGWQKAQPASASRLAALKTFGLRYVELDDFNVLVEGEYTLNLAMSFWRANDGSAQGYLVSTLHDEIRGKQLHEKPAAGRDSGAVIGGVPPIDNQAKALAESAAGSIAPESPTSTATLLPEVSPCR